MVRMRQEAVRRNRPRAVWILLKGIKGRGWIVTLKHFLFNRLAVLE